MAPRTNDPAREGGHPAAAPAPRGGPAQDTPRAGVGGEDAPDAPRPGAGGEDAPDGPRPAPREGDAPDSPHPAGEHRPAPHRPAEGVPADAHGHPAVPQPAADAPRPGDGAEVSAAGGGGGERVVVALRRFAAAARRGRGPHLVSCAVLLAVAMTAGAVAVGGDGRDTARAAAPAAGPVTAGMLTGGGLDTAIRSLRAHLHAQPKDFGAWATLGLVHVERARTDGDPTRYAPAEEALGRSLALRPGNDQALAGQAALAAARHDFPGALEYADRALAQNPYSERALCSRIDALVELGRYEEAERATRVADRRRPGVPVFTRYAYVRELRGDVTTARRVLHRALDGAASAADVAYVATALGNLERGQGRYPAALHHYARALAADDAHLPALEGRARAQSAGGDRAGAVRTLEQVVARSPLPGPLVALGELYEARGGPGDRARAREQYALVDAWTALARAGGVDADLDTALAAADHGDTAEALRAARAEWGRRHTVHTADALAWALHRSGRSAEALPYARRATATGYRDAAFLYHRGMIERAAGHHRAAHASLTAALELNPGFSPLGARAARAALEELTERTGLTEREAAR
ncbi:hypothetical protein [Streptomyces sp. NPDC085937]|uniref:hypothetical protein n=1 Tax=Streptomyces sp. NPDC085937 TaxID=3365742 RepID=UPI0037D0D0D5